jgi:hypothetical protein
MQSRHWHRHQESNEESARPKVDGNLGALHGLTLPQETLQEKRTFGKGTKAFARSLTYPCFVLRVLVPSWLELVRPNQGRRNRKKQRAALAGRTTLRRPLATVVFSGTGIQLPPGVWQHSRIDGGFNADQLTTTLSPAGTNCRLMPSASLDSVSTLATKASRLPPLNLTGRSRML